MRTVFALLLSSSLAFAGEIEIKKSPVPINSLASVKYKLEKGEQVVWKVYPQPMEVEQVTDSEYAYLFFNGEPREYSIDATIVNFDKKTLVLKSKSVVIGGQVPPNPPGPNPPNPVPPTDPLFDKIKAEYDKDSSSTKKTDAIQLGAVYVAVAEQIKDITTAGQLFTVVKSASDMVIGERLKSVRAIVGGELAKVMPANPDTVLTDDNKKQAASQLIRFGKLIGELK